MKHFEEFDKLIDHVVNPNTDSRLFKVEVTETGKQIFFSEISSDKVVAFVMWSECRDCNIVVPEEVNGKSVVGIYFGQDAEFESILVPGTVECILGTENISKEYSKIFVAEDRHFRSMNTFKDSYVISSDGEDLLWARVTSEDLLRELLQKVKTIHCLRINSDLRELVLPESVEKIVKLRIYSKSLVFDGVVPELMPESLCGVHVNTVFVKSTKKENGAVRMDNLSRCISSSEDSYKANILYSHPVFPVFEKSKTPGFIVLTSETDGESIFVNARYIAVIRPCTYKCCGVDDFGFYTTSYVTGSEVLVGMVDRRGETGTWIRVYETKEEIDKKMSANETKI